MAEEQKYGTLLTPDIKIHRRYFAEMLRLIGIKVVYRAPKSDKQYTTYTEIDANYEQPIVIGCIFEEHPKQQTMKKLGWMSELQEESSLIHVEYDTPGLQRGALFIVPSGLDNASGRLFRVTKMTTDIIYPSSITCQIVPEYESTYSASQSDYTHNSFTLLSDEEE